MVSSFTQDIWRTLGRSLGYALIKQGLGQLKHYGYVVLVTLVGNGVASHVEHSRWLQKSVKSFLQEAIPRVTLGIKTR